MYVRAYSSTYGLVLRSQRTFARQCVSCNLSGKDQLTGDASNRCVGRDVAGQLQKQAFSGWLFLSCFVCVAVPFAVSRACVWSCSGITEESLSSQTKSLISPLNRDHHGRLDAAEQD